MVSITCYTLIAFLLAFIKLNEKTVLSDFIWTALLSTTFLISESLRNIDGFCSSAFIHLRVPRVFPEPGEQCPLVLCLGHGMMFKPEINIFVLFVFFTVFTAVPELHVISSIIGNNQLFRIWRKKKHAHAVAYILCSCLISQYFLMLDDTSWGEIIRRLYDNASVLGCSTITINLDLSASETTLFPLVRICAEVWVVSRFAPPNTL